MAPSAGVGLVARTVRALRLDPTLYREVTAPGAGNRQAVVLILITAVIWGFQTILVRTTSVFGGAVDLDSGLLVALFAVPAIAQIASWLIWAFGLWIIATRWVPREHEVPCFGQVARALAFAQAPIVFAVVIAVLATLFVRVVSALVLILIPAELREGYPQLVVLGNSAAVWGISGLVTAWVLVGTFVATREALRLSNGRTLVALLTVNLVGATLLAVIVVVLSGVAGREAVGLMEDWVGFRDDNPSAVDVAYRLDFNFGFLGLSDRTLYYLSRSLLHPFAGVSGA